MGITLFLMALFLLYILNLPLIIYSLFRVRNINKYFYELAASIDQFGNVLGSALFNDLFVKKDGHPFGDRDETISSVVGKNYLTDKLTFLGRIFRRFLDFAFGKNHSVDSVGHRITKPSNNGRQK